MLDCESTSDEDRSKRRLTPPLWKQVKKSLRTPGIHGTLCEIFVVVAAHKKEVAMGPDFVTPLKKHEEVTVALGSFAPAGDLAHSYGLVMGRDMLGLGDRPSKKM